LSFFSKTTKSRPACLQFLAAAIPLGPAPIMQTRFLSRPTSLAYDPDSEGVTRGAVIEVRYAGI